MEIRADPQRSYFCATIVIQKGADNEKGIITTLVVTICMMLTTAYAFAASSKTEKKEVKRSYNNRKAEATTAESLKQKPRIRRTQYREEANFNGRRSDIENAEEVSDDQEESDDSEEEIDDEEMDHCNHRWVSNWLCC